MSNQARINWHLLLQLALVAIGAVVVVACGNQAMRAGTVLEPSPSTVAGDTIFADDFESGTLGTWEDGYDPARHHIVTDPGEARSGTRYLVATYPAGDDGGWLTHFFMPGYDSLQASFDVRFPRDWRGGTKLLALYGSRTDDQWSAFGKAGLCPDGTDFFGATVVADRGGNPGPIRFYTYFPGMRREPDGVTCWGRFGDGTETYSEPLELSRGEWHHVEFHVSLNAVGQADARQTFRLNGVQRGHWEGLVLRTTSALRLNAVQLSFSTDADTQPRELHIDNLVVRIGGR